VVRRDGLDGELTALGADRVVTEECDLRRETRNLCEGALPKLGLNAVGGASALNIANALAPGSTLVTYGAMGLQPLKIPNGLLIFSDLRFTGFWLTNWKKRTSAAEREEVFAELGALLGTGALRLPVGSVFPLEALHAALDTAQAAGRTGKILLCPGTGPA
jgi:trans-2-enoyl-CoA reductase